MKVRQDAWTDENDLLLAETVLRHVREGSTQLNAFEEVGDKLNRTASACGFRWNAVVREQYEKALDLAKKQRKQRLRSLGDGKPAKKQLLYSPPTPTFVETSKTEAAIEPTSILETKHEQAPVTYPNLNKTQTQRETSSSTITIDDVIQFLSSMSGDRYQTSRLQQENELLRNENSKLLTKNEELEKQIIQLENDSKTIEEDYQTLMNIMNRARKLALFEEEERPANKFKMDRNGNLERLAE
ncbi:RsfA family transcriptional regulator [Bacillus salitolerans]|uniref:RsfA family transcriptional regulator n=1 Tax=Bacillus salitolerans TaxID=1437434 RepID=A0ABW4LK97_9BACI